MIAALIFVAAWSSTMVLRQIRRPWVVCAPARSSQQRSQVVTKCLLNSIRRSHQIEVF